MVDAGRNLRIGVLQFCMFRYLISSKFPQEDPVTETADLTLFSLSLLFQLMECLLWTQTTISELQH